ncbi:MAG TPA: hypothetical protein VFE93_03025 [Myxococcaceae bacterium]|nr:hypothetical protein [Myxococcaceae bacterium]
MRTLYLILYIVAGVLFLLSAILTYRPPAGEGGVTVGRINLLALGLLAWVLVPLIQTADRLND